MNDLVVIVVMAYMVGFIPTAVIAALARSFSEPEEDLRTYGEPRIVAIVKVFGVALLWPIFSVAGLACKAPDIWTWMWEEPEG
jgi:hypothetical protein